VIILKNKTLIMSSIDLYDDFNEEQDARAGDYDEGEGGDDDNNSNRGLSDNDGNQDDQEDKEKVAPKVKVVKTKRKIPKLNVERMKGPRGIISIDEYFTNMKFKGKGYEKQDLDEVMLRLQHWAHR
jgi:TIMELESS-interacting protein